jgi:hypothetical protein
MGHRQSGTLAVKVLNTIGVAEILNHHFYSGLEDPRIYGRGGVMVQIDWPALGHLGDAFGGSMLIHGNLPRSHPSLQRVEPRR